MRRLGVWVVGAVLLAGVTMTVAAAGDRKKRAAEPEPAAEESKGAWGWFTGLFRWGKKEEPKAIAQSEQVAAEVNRAAALREEAEARQVREMNALLRRLEVCDRLREIAWQTNDPYLEGQAVQLEERASAVYAQRMANLPAAGESSLDEEILQKHTRIGSASTRGLTAPVQASKKARAGDRAEVKP